jgi:predicted kinase
MMAQQAPLAFLVHRYLGVGKTTLARRLEAEHAAIRFTHDEWMLTLYSDDPPEALFAEYAGRVSGLIEATWTRCLELGLNVVLDFGFWSRSERDRTRALIAKLGGECRLYCLTCPDEIARQRIQGRNEDLDPSLFIAPATYDALRRASSHLARMRSHSRGLPASAVAGRARCLRP